MTHTEGSPRVPVLVVVGVGLIGGSFCAALRKAGFVGRIIGAGRNPQSLQRAVDLGLVDEVRSLADAAKDADLVFLATPVGAMRAVFAELRPYLKEGAVVTDAGSSKGDVVEVARAELGDRIACFVPGHPIAGSEQSGPEAASATLYQGRDVVLTPLAENTPEAIALVRSAWDACGARIHCMSAVEHDEVLASVSHLPHLLAFAYMLQVGGTRNVQQRLDLAGSGFRDFTRIAGSSPEMWRDILLANRHAILHELDEYRKVLDDLVRVLHDGDGDGLTRALARASDLRRGWSLS